jgi:hypothetical protein
MDEPDIQPELGPFLHTVPVYGLITDLFAGYPAFFLSVIRPETGFICRISGRIQDSENSRISGQLFTSFFQMLLFG